MTRTKAILGYSDTETVKLDFDNMSLKTVKYWAYRTMSWFKLGGLLILKSSANCYHVVFNRTVLWSENMHIVAWVSLLTDHKTLIKWFLMQCIKECSTLRVSSKIEKPSPRIVYRYGDQDQEIHNFLHHRKMIKKIVKKLPISKI